MPKSLHPLIESNYSTIQWKLPYIIDTRHHTTWDIRHHHRPQSCLYFPMEPWHLLSRDSLLKYSQKPQGHKSHRESNLDIKPFIHVETVSLWRSSRHKQHPVGMIQIDPTSKYSCKTQSCHGLLILTNVAFVTSASSLSNAVSISAELCIQSWGNAYDDFVECNFDCINNTSLLDQIYMKSQSSNENYTIKEILAQSDKVQFLKIMEVRFMFRDLIWKLVPRSKMI